MSVQRPKYSCPLMSTTVARSIAPTEKLGKPNIRHACKFAKWNRAQRRSDQRRISRRYPWILVGETIGTITSVANKRGRRLSMDSSATTFSRYLRQQELVPTER